MTSGRSGTDRAATASDEGVGTRGQLVRVPIQHRRHYDKLFAPTAAPACGDCRQPPVSRTFAPVWWQTHASSRPQASVSAGLVANVRLKPPPFCRRGVQMGIAISRLAGVWPRMARGVEGGSRK